MPTIKLTTVLNVYQRSTKIDSKLCVEANVKFSFKVCNHSDGEVLIYFGDISSRLQIKN